MSNPPFSGVEPLAPLCGAALLYFVFLVVLRIALWPTLQYLRKRSPLRRYVALLLDLVVRLVLALALFVLGLFGFLALTGGDLALDVNLDRLSPDEISPSVALLLLVGLLVLALLPLRGLRRFAPRRGNRSGGGQGGTGAG